MIEEDKKDPGPQVKFIDGKPVGSSYSIDADTTVVDDQSYRIQGFNAFETAKDKAGIIVPNQYQGDRTQEFVNRFAETGEFDRLNTKGQDPAFKNRVLARQVNLEGEDLASVMTSLGVIDPTAFSNPEDINNSIASGSISRLFPTADSTDPLRALAKEKKDYDKAQGVRWEKTSNVASPAEYKAFQDAVGATAAAAAATEVERLNEVLATEEMSDSTRSLLTTQLEEARGRVLFAALTPRIIGGVNYQPNDRNIMNKATGFINQSYAALNVATTMFVKGIGGVLEMAGEKGQWDYISQKGKEYQLKAELYDADTPSYVATVSDIDTSNPFSAVADTGLFLSNNLITMIPLWTSALAAGGVAATLGAPAVVAAGISVLPGWLTYTGGMYSDQPEGEKNPAQASSFGLFASVLDRLGIEAIFAKGASSLLTKKGLDEMVAIVVAKKGVTPEVAKEQIATITKKELIETAKFSSAFAKSQVATMAYATKALARISAAGITEGVTETAQSALELIAATGQWNLDARYQKDFNKQLVDSFIAGGAIGGVITGAGEAKTLAQLHSAYDYHRTNTRDLDDNQKAQLSLEEEYNSGSLPGIGTEFNTFNVAKGIQLQSHDFIAGNPRNATDAVKMTNKEGFINILTDGFRLLRGHANQMTKKLYNADGKFLRNRAVIKSLMSGMGIVPGQPYSGFKRSLLGEWAAKHTSSANISAEMNMSEVESGNVILDAYRRFWSKGLDTPVEHPNFEALNRYHSELGNMQRTARGMANESGVSSSLIDNLDSLFVPEIDKHTFNKNKDTIIDKLMAQGMPRSEANKTVENIFSSDKGKMRDASEAIANAGLFRDPELDHIFEKNFFRSLEGIKERLAANIAINSYYGKDAEILYKLADMADQNGEFSSPEEKQTYLSEIKDYFDMIEGKYNTLDNYPVIKNVYAWTGTLTMLAMLGKAGLSSLPEVALSLLGTRGEKVGDQLGLWAKNMLSEIGDDAFTRSNSFVTSALRISKLGNVALKTQDIKLAEQIAEIEAALKVAQAGKGNDKELDAIGVKLDSLYEESIGRTLFEDLGFAETGFNTQSRFEYADNSMRNVMGLFAKITLLKQTTESTRMAAISMASDTVASYVEALRGVPVEMFRTGKGLTKFQYQALKELQAYGMNVPDVMFYIENTESGELNSLSSRYEMFVLKGKENVTDVPFNSFMRNINTAVSNMVDSNVPNPQPHNIPKYYHDPRFRIITVMTRYLAALQTSVIPKLYNDYIKDGNVGMRYQAFSVMVGAMALSGLANGLKDQLSYGEDSPYINGIMKNAQRTLYGAGLLGRGEVIVDAMAPLYNRKGVSLGDAMSPGNDRSTIGGWVYDTAKSNMAPVAWADRFVRAGSAISDGDYPTAGRQLARAMPLIGSVPRTYDELEELFVNSLKEK